MHRILVVDDEPMIRRGLEKLIQQADTSLIHTDTAENGVDALEKIRSSRPTILFTDIRMPRMDGLELCQRMQELYGDIPIVVVSGYGDFEYAQKCMSYGVKEYLLKPVTKAGVQGAVNKLLAGLATESERAYISLSKLELWLEQIEEAVWHLQDEVIREMIEEMRIYCSSRRIEERQLAQLLNELLAKLVKQIKQRDVYPIVCEELLAEASRDSGFDGFERSVQGLMKLIRAKRKGLLREPVEEAKGYIERNLSKELSLEEVADMLGLNASYFSQLFKQMTGETFVHYRIKRRMELAKKLLAAGNHKITDVSYEVGYADHPHFTKTFKKFTGYTPSEYRATLGIE
ncbi:DNA-binding response regulator [Paenibacillus sp. FSL H8-0548]|uniref:response regulator transcription factor n=1 Tax=Paenibacillus sp. FSL H8-0548 TaxID=1920422 RepID=UPI00096FFAA5|nr:response regulator [Paenibacillus sp. FSL H8-0548]OMF38065.1 DNA-binding response regulator [Paenibacillus sp. FSL H8-0548]